jgi:hypothetical protein
MIGASIRTPCVLRCQVEIDEAMGRRQSNGQIYHTWSRCIHEGDLAGYTHKHVFHRHSMANA